VALKKNEKKEGGREKKSSSYLEADTVFLLGNFPQCASSKMCLDIWHAISLTSCTAQTHHVL